MQRRRQLMAMQNKCPYIKNGLVFWLDGILKGSDPTKWVDRIGRREFLLTDCSFTDNGVVFNGSTKTSGGVYNGRIDVGWDEGTIECAANKIESMSAILYPGNAEGKSNIGFIRGAGTNTGYRIDGQTTKRAAVPTTARIASLNCQRCISNFNLYAFGNNDNWSNNNNGVTTIGYRITVGSASAYVYTGTMHSIRIYNRILSEDEMIHNQQIDNERFNLGLTF